MIISGINFNGQRHFTCSCGKEVYVDNDDIPCTVDCICGRIYEVEATRMHEGSIQTAEVRCIRG